MENDGESSCSKRTRVSGECSNSDDYIYDYEYNNSYDYDYNDADDDEYMNAAEETEVAPPPPYVVLTEHDVLSRQVAETAATAEILSIPPAFATILLRRYKWITSNLQEDWFSDERRVRAAAGLPPASGGAMALSSSPLICKICFDLFPAGETRSAGCAAHFYCDDCWRGYIHAAVGDGARCLSLRCPDPSCPAAVVGDLVDAALTGDEDIKKRYAMFALRSYVEESGGGRIKWCPGAGCTRAVESVGAGDDADEVFCACRHGFCFRCGEEAHRPVSCGTVRAWMAKNKSDSLTATWVLANAKPCPKCKRPIEKRDGCNHIWCPPPCDYHFCWLCFKRAGTREHYACGMYQPQVNKKDLVDETDEEEIARRARESLGRYLFHYERWAGNLKSLEKVYQDMDELEKSELERMAAVVGVPVTEMGFMMEAYEQVAYGRRVLRWSHAYGYYLDPERDGKKRELFDYLHTEANASLERLHKCAEIDRRVVFICSEGESSAAIAKRFKEYKANMMNFTVATRTFMGNLVKAFETDLPEVFAINF